MAQHTSTTRPSHHTALSGDKTNSEATPIDYSVLNNYAIHPAADRFPLMPEAELRALAADIRENGLREPILMFDGQVIDGRNRLVACHLAGVEPRFEPWQPGHDEDTPTTYIWSRNGVRRHLTQSQKAALAAILADEIAKERQRHREAHRQAKKGAREVTFSAASTAVDTPTTVKSRPSDTTLVFTSAGHKPTKPAEHPFTPPSPGKFRTGGRARDHAASTFGVSSGYVAQAQSLQRTNPQLFQQVLDGKLPLTQAVQHAADRNVVPRRTAEEVGNVLQRLTTGGTKTKGKETKPRIRIPKFGPVQSSRTTVDITVTFGNTTVAEEWLNRLQDDPRVLSMSFQVVDPATRESTQSGSRGKTDKQTAGSTEKTTPQKTTTRSSTGTGHASRTTS